MAEKTGVTSTKPDNYITPVCLSLAKLCKCSSHNDLEVGFPGHSVGHLQNTTFASINLFITLSSKDIS